MFACNGGPNTDWNLQTIKKKLHQSFFVIFVCNIFANMVCLANMTQLGNL